MISMVRVSMFIVLPLRQLCLIASLTQLLFPLPLQGLFLLAQVVDHLHGQRDLRRRDGLEKQPHHQLVDRP